MDREITFTLSQQQLNDLCDFMAVHIDVLDSGDITFDKSIKHTYKILHLIKVVTDNRIKAEKHLDKCEYDECKFCRDICVYGMRNTVGCYIDDEEKHEAMLRNQSELQLLKAKFEYQSDLTDDEKIGLKEVDRMLRKTFRFVFKGHEYTINDSARDQSCCPHCGLQSSGGGCWSIDNKSYIGTYMDVNNPIECFECPECFKKFFYHACIEKKLKESKNNG